MTKTLKTLKTEVLTRLERLSRAGFMTAKLLTAVTLVSSAAFPASVFTSTFSDPNNVGEIGGGLVSGSGDAAINQGPWDGTYHGILGLLAAPELTVSTTGGVSGGSGTISGIVGVNLIGLGLTNNYGWFFQQTNLTYNANTLYTLTADISTGGVVNPVSLFSNDGVGIGLTHGPGDTLEAASTDPGAILSIIALSGSFYQATLQFQTGSTAPTGDIGIRLFDQPTGLLTANLLSQVTFSNVNLDATATPEPATMALSGLGLLLVGILKRKVAR